MMNTKSLIVTCAVLGCLVALVHGRPESGADDRAGESCPPAGFICGQDAAGDTWLFSDLGVSDGAGHTGRVTSEQFPPPGVTIADSIGVVSWYGAYLDQLGRDCIKAHQFRIEFYDDVQPPQGNPPMPDAYHPTHSFTLFPVVAEVIPGPDPSWGLIGVDEYRFVAILPTPVSKLSGHFSIASATIEQGCYHVLGPSLAPEGNNATWRWWDPLAPTLSQFDIHYCFSEKVAGNCCADVTGTCAPSDALTCELQGGRFTTGSCESLDPPCGQGPGACCYDDGTCLITSFLECEGGPATGAHWLGSGTTCGQCCTVICPPGGNWTPENELRCGDPNWAQTNGGCFFDGVPLFQEIGCGETICGELGRDGTPACNGDANCDSQVDFDDINPFVDALLNGVYCDTTGHKADVNDDGAVDFYDINPFVRLLTEQPLPIHCFTAYHLEADVYKYTATGPTAFSWFLRSESGALVEIWNAGSGTCVDEWLIDFAPQARCVDALLATRCLPAGTYYFVVKGVFATCGWDYKAWLTCTTPCEPCLVTCPGDSTSEGEGCGGNVNAGCSGPSPYVFTPIFLDPNGHVTVCGSLWAHDGQHDVDFYQFAISAPKIVSFTFDNEMPIESSVYAKDPFPSPAGCDDATQVFADRFYPACGPTIKSFNLPAGTWIFYVVPATDSTAIYHGYPCFSGENDYVMSVSVPPVECPTLMDAVCSGLAAEGEPQCFDGYVDAFNPGCDAASPPGPMIVIGDLCANYSGGNDYIICGKAGAYHTSADPNSPFSFDSDWFTFALSTPAWLCIGGEGEMPLDYDFYDAAQGCAGAPLSSGRFDACLIRPDENPIPPYNVGDPVPAPVPAGTYWLRIGLAVDAVATPCTADYGLLLGCRQCPEAVR